MKRTIFSTAVGFSMFFSIPVFAGNEEVVDQPSASMASVVTPEASHCESKGADLPWSDRNALILACLAKASSPANVNAIALQQKKLNCAQNAKNKKLQGSKKEEYLTACLYKNEAMLAFESINQRYASSDVNEVLRQSPTATGNK